ncbi:MAG: hypothetical protein AB7G06_03100 [Bdellovibrionales bacterium]
MRHVIIAFCAATAAMFGTPSVRAQESASETPAAAAETLAQRMVRTNVRVMDIEGTCRSPGAGLPVRFRSTDENNFFLQQVFGADYNPISIVLCESWPASNITLTDSIVANIVITNMMDIAIDRIVRANPGVELDRDIIRQAILSHEDVHAFTARDTMAMLLYGRTALSDSEQLVVNGYHEAMGDAGMNCFMAANAADNGEVINTHMLAMYQQRRSNRGTHNTTAVLTPAFLAELRSTCAVLDLPEDRVEAYRLVNLTTVRAMLRDPWQHLLQRTAAPT